MMETKDQCCGRCGYGGCDVRIVDCGCCLHARCTPVDGSVLASCPRCNHPATNGLQLLPISFEELDEARRAAAALSISGKRGKKRKSATIARLNPEVSATTTADDAGGNEASDLRTGRWTTEETLYCDKLIQKFEQGQLPLVDGIKLNDFLANMLKSKQSRLTKKMKNAKLSTRTFKREGGHITDSAEAREFSAAEDSFFHSIQCSMERAEIRFHMQKEWREQFSSFCVQMGQNLDADAWLYSVEEMDRRMSQAKDAARMARRKHMMGYALSKDAANPDQGVFIDRAASREGMDSNSVSSRGGEMDEFMNLVMRNAPVNGGTKQPAARTASSLKKVQPSPFLSKVVAYLRRQNIPFEHVDAWVPSFVPASNGNDTIANSEPNCRLCYAGSATADVQVAPDGRESVALTMEDQFDWFAFGEYSQKFSFDVGCGLPGRVYQSGVSSWEQNVQNAPHHHFERCGGAIQWGIKTVLGVPIPSPNVGRIVVVLYSRHDRQKDQDMVAKICDGLSEFLPSPKWKLVVDIGAENVSNNGTEAEGAGVASSGMQADSRVNEIVLLLQEHMPSNRTSHAAAYLPGFTSLRLTLLKHSKSPREIQMLGSLLDSYSSYVSTGRPKSDIALLLVRDFMFFSQQQEQQHAPSNNIMAGGNQFPLQSSSHQLGASVATGVGVPQVAALHSLPTQALVPGSQPNVAVGQVQHPFSPHCNGGISSISMR